MVGFGGVMLVLMAVLGGAWGWHVGTKRLYRRSSFSMADGRAAIPRRRWRKIERYLFAALYAASVAVVAAIVVALLAKR
jgi:hypothetical protein